MAGMDFIGAVLFFLLLLCATGVIYEWRAQPRSRRSTMRDVTMVRHSMAVRGTPVDHITDAEILEGHRRLNRAFALTDDELDRWAAAICRFSREFGRDTPIAPRS